MTRHAGGEVGVLASKFLVALSKNFLKFCCTPYQYTQITKLLLNLSD